MQYTLDTAVKIYVNNLILWKELAKLAKHQFWNWKSHTYFNVLCHEESNLFRLVVNWVLPYIKIDVKVPFNTNESEKPQTETVTL